MLRERSGCALVIAGLLWSATFPVGEVRAAAVTVAPAKPDGREGGSDPRWVAVAYIEAVGNKQFDRVSSLLHPDVEFQMPGKEIHGAQEYVATLQRLGPVLLRNEVKTTVAEGKNVCVLYDFVTDTTAGAVPSVEWVRVEDGRIRSIRLVFHSLPWPTVVAELARRTAPSTR